MTCIRLSARGGGRLVRQEHVRYSVETVDLIDIATCVLKGQ